jgi:dCMP deaminase
MQEKLKPRTVPCRDDYYMGLAFWIASKSKDPSTQIGSILVGEDNSTISMGYNGPPRNIDDDSMDWNRPQKYDWICHSEQNVIKWARRKVTSLHGSTLYVTGKPCKACMLSIVNEEISRVVYRDFKTNHGSMLNDEDSWLIVQNIAKLGKVNLEQFVGSLNWMQEAFENMKTLGIFSDSTI